MDFQKFLEITGQKRAYLRTAEQGQLSLGALIKAVESCSQPDAEVSYDLGYMKPYAIDSWRGSYSELALSYEGGKDGLNRDQFIDLLRAAVGKQYYGYKGGYFLMTEDTPVWVSNYGEACDTAVTGVKDCGYRIVLLTSFMDY